MNWTYIRGKSKIKNELENEDDRLFTENPINLQQKLRELEKFPVVFDKSALFRPKKGAPGTLFAISANHFPASAKFNYRSPLSKNMFVLSTKPKR